MSEHEIPTSWVLDKADLKWLLAAIEGTDWVDFDLETTGLHEHAVTGGPVNGGVAARVVLASFTLIPDGTTEPRTWEVPLSHPDSPWRGQWRKVLRILARALVRAQSRLCGHNVKFDCRWVLATTGIDISPLVGWDTMVSSHLLDENSSTKLKERAPATFGIDRWDEHDLTYPGAAEDVPLFPLGEYAAGDTYWTHRLRRQHQWMLNLDDPSEPADREEQELHRIGLLSQWVSMPTVRTLTAMEQRGMGLDIEWTRETLSEHSEDAGRLYETLVGRYPNIEGKPSFAPTSTWFQNWTTAAVEAGDLMITSVTGTGKPSWAGDVLQRQANSGNEVARALLDFRGLDKRAQFLRSWLAKVSPDGRVHASYNVGSVVTGRLSSSDPNMQQVTKALRPAFIPSEGCYLLELDYSQIELRVAAYISRSAPMLNAFREGQDLHTLLASQITGKSLGAVEPHERQAGKSANFGLLYGMSVDGFRTYADVVYGVQFTLDEASRVHSTFFDTWEGLRQWHESTITKVHRTGQVISPIGRVRRLPGVWGYNPGDAERAAINSPVQGFASDMMQIAAATIEGALPGYSQVEGAALVGTVHDSIILEIRQDGWEGIVEECRRRMTEEVVSVLSKRLDCDLDVPLVADPTVSTRWGLGDVLSS